MAKLLSGTRVYGNLTVDTFVTATGNVVSTGNVVATANVYSNNVIVPNQDQVVAYIFAF